MKVVGVFTTSTPHCSMQEREVHHTLKCSLHPRASLVPTASAGSHTLYGAETKFLILNWRQICKV